MTGYSLCDVLDGIAVIVQFCVYFSFLYLSEGKIEPGDRTALAYDA